MGGGPRSRWPAAKHKRVVHGGHSALWWDKLAMQRYQLQSMDRRQVKGMAGRAEQGTWCGKWCFTPPARRVMGTGRFIC